VLSLLIALLSVFGYDVTVAQPKLAEIEAQLEQIATEATLEPLVAQRGTTNVNDLAVDSLSASGAVAAGGTLSGGALIQGARAITLTAGLQVTPDRGVYVLSSSAAVSMTLTAPTSPGQLLLLYGDDANTITVNDSNIYTTDGNAVTIGQYDLVGFLSVGSKWVHLFKSANS
jgi:hypothetical protein